jgi:hypothetical protein
MRETPGYLPRSCLRLAPGAWRAFPSHARQQPSGAAGRTTSGIRLPVLYPPCGARERRAIGLVP